MTFDEELTEILDIYHEEILQAVATEGMRQRTAIAAIKALIERAVIGEDEAPEGQPPYMTPNGKRSEMEVLIAQSQNALRRSQRAVLHKENDTMKQQGGEG